MAARDGRPIILIVGMLGRKDATGFFEAFTELSPRIFATAFDSASATPARTLARTARSVGLEATGVHGGVAAAMARALRVPGPPPHVVVCGSLRFVGDVLVLSPETWPT
jgi:dihydrofolate synthase/folylpolyglutamate synthase